MKCGAYPVIVNDKSLVASLETSSKIIEGLRVTEHKGLAPVRASPASRVPKFLMQGFIYNFHSLPLIKDNVTQRVTLDKRNLQRNQALKCRGSGA